MPAIFRHFSHLVEDSVRGSLRSCLVLGSQNRLLVLHCWIIYLCHNGVDDRLDLLLIQRKMDSPKPVDCSTCIFIVTLQYRHNVILVDLGGREINTLDLCCVVGLKRQPEFSLAPPLKQVESAFSDYGSRFYIKEFICTYGLRVTNSRRNTILKGNLQNQTSWRVENGNTRWN